MEVEEYDADDTVRVEAGRVIANAASAVDSPWLWQVTPYRQQMHVRWGWDASPRRHLLACAGGRPVAVAEVEIGEWDNRDYAWVHLTVHPEQRRRGHGSDLFDHIRRLSVDAGCTKIGGSAWETAACEPFAHRHGLVRASQEIYRRVTLPDLPEGFAREAYDEAAGRAADYELVRLSGRADADQLPAVAQLTGAINDAPSDDLDIEDEVFPPERIRDYEDATIESGHRLLRVFARHRNSGELVGQTVVAVDAETPERAHQHDTSVVRAHRGHALGLLLKAEMLLWLAESEPQVVTLDTWNAESNHHMIRVNERLGYLPLGRELAFQGRLQDA